ncbi:MAG: hypothetical protein AABZ64_15710 [Nitrospinota bacterium]
MGGIAIHAVCIHGRRARAGGGDFLLAAQLLGRAAERAGLHAQVRTPGWPKPPGAPDRAVARISPAPFNDLDIPWRYHLEVAADPLLAVIPPLGNALLPGGRLLVNAPSLPRVPAGGPAARSADLSALADRLGGLPGAALAAGAWAVLGEIGPGLPFDLAFVEEAVAAHDGGSLPLARAAFQLVRQACAAGRPETASPGGAA